MLKATIGRFPVGFEIVIGVGGLGCSSLLRLFLFLVAISLALLFLSFLVLLLFAAVLLFSGFLKLSLDGHLHWTPSLHGQ